MFDMDGNVIGINTAIFERNGSIGIGFSIPSNSAKIVIDQLIEFGETKRGWLGVRIQDVTEEIADVEKLDEPRGALVASVAENSPSDKTRVGKPCKKGKDDHCCRPTKRHISCKCGVA